jgi:hypothetical protein
MLLVVSIAVGALVGFLVPLLTRLSLLWAKTEGRLLRFGEERRLDPPSVAIGIAGLTALGAIALYLSPVRPDFTVAATVGLFVAVIVESGVRIDAARRPARRVGHNSQEVNS